MQVLVCDFDAASRAAVKRLLEEKFACVVHESADGIDALEKLSREKYAFVVLEVDMPTMSGVEILNEIRNSATTRDLPVIILSRHRQEEAVLKLMRLGISDYLIKPPQSHTLVAKIEKLVKMLPRAGARTSDLTTVRLSPDTPALFVDGNPDFRFFFGREVAKYGTVTQADSGAAALGAFHRAPVSLVFIGGDLGLVGAERLIQKIRDIRPHGTRIVHVTDPGAEAAKLRSKVDAVLARSYVPQKFRTALRPFVLVPGPFPVLSKLVPELRDMIGSAATQVFGMMFDADITPSREVAPLEPGFSAAIVVLLADRFAIQLSVHLPRAAATASAARMLSLPAAELADEDLLSVAGELCNMVTGRIHARVRERKMKSVCSLPSLVAGATFTAPGDGDGMALRYSMPDAGDFVVSLVVEDGAKKAEESAAAAPVTPVASVAVPEASEAVAAEAPVESAAVLDGAPAAADSAVAVP
jgi:two-component system chemotaxis response regulator CheY